jgi:hypothetical protein
MKTIPDSNILIDLFQADAEWRQWSAMRLAESREAGPIVINPVIYAEASGHYLALGEVQHAFSAVGVEYEDVPWPAAFLAGQAFRAYRRRGGQRDRVLPDFLIGAHASAGGYRLLTRDPGRYRSHFPGLDIIAPDSHP